MKLQAPKEIIARFDSNIQNQSAQADLPFSLY